MKFILKKVLSQLKYKYILCYQNKYQAKKVFFVFIESFYVLILCSIFLSIRILLQTLAHIVKYIITEKKNKSYLCLVVKLLVYYYTQTTS